MPERKKINKVSLLWIPCYETYQTRILETDRELITPSL